MQRCDQTYLLPEADAWAGVEWKEYERILCKIFRDALVKEAVWVEFVRCVFEWHTESIARTQMWSWAERTIGTPVLLPAMHPKHRVRDPA